ncbi:MAG: hypothetical protein ABIB79_04115 [archaeon]
MKNKILNKNNTKVLTVVTSILILSFCISAFSVAFTSSISIEPGQTIEKAFALINTAEGAQDLTVKATVKEGSEYVSLPDGETYNIAPGKTGAVKVVFNVPADAQNGDVYPAKVSFETIEGSSLGGGTLSYKIGHTISFDINVMDKVPTTATPTQPETTTPSTQTPAETSMSWLYWLIGLLIIVVVVWIIMKRNKK